jgi:tetratricopeptide (TPR) repeat protein
MASRHDLPQAMQFCQKALNLSKICGDINLQYNALIDIAFIKSIAGEYCTAQVYATETQRLLKLPTILFQKAKALQVGAMCSTALGDFTESLNTLLRRKMVLSMCGLVGGDLDYRMTLSQGDTHFLKSEYAHARHIYSQIIESTSPDQNALAYALSLANIVQIDIRIGGDSEAVYQKSNKAEDVFGGFQIIPGRVHCKTLQAEIELRDRQFDLAKLKFQECLVTACGTDYETSSFCLEQLANNRAWPISEWQSKWPMIYCGHAYKTSDKLALQKAFLFLRDMFLTTNNVETIRNLYTVALEGFTQMDIHCSRANCMICLGDLAHQQQQQQQPPPPPQC